jgi:hypothetical protein
MDLYTFLVGLYDQFLSLFPQPLQWLITLIVVIGLVAAFVNLIRHNTLFLIVLILLLPVVVPVLRHFFADLYSFFLYLLGILGVSAPA